MSVMRFVYSKLSRVMSTRQSVQESADAADAQMRAKLQLLEFTFSKYNRVLPTDRSIEKSLRGLRPLPLTRGGSQSTYTCFQKTFPQFNRTLSTDAAMDRTITACTGA